MCIPPTLYVSEAFLAFDNNFIFQHVNLTLAAGCWVSLLGPSGVGKSSFLKMIAGIQETDVFWDCQIKTDNGLPHQQQVAYMGQTDLLLPWLSALENTLLGYKLRYPTTDYHSIKQKAEQLLQQVGLGEALHLYPNQLSGGMRQRVAIVRTLMEDKPIILMDEPFSALDAITRYKLQNLTAKLLQHKTVLFITHDPVEALRLSDEIYLLLGKPASMKKFISFQSAIPRDINDAEIAELETKLFHQLANAMEE